MPRIVNCTSIKGVVTEESGSKGLVYRQVVDKKDGYTYGVTCNDVMPGGTLRLHLGIHITYVLKGLGELGKRTGSTNQGRRPVYIGPNGVSTTRRRDHGAHRPAGMAVQPVRWIAWICSPKGEGGTGYWWGARPWLCHCPWYRKQGYNMFSSNRENMEKRGIESAA